MSRTSTTTTTAGDGLYTYGLAGIGMQREAERRFDGRAVAQPMAPSAGVVHPLRRMAGDALIRLGAALAGTAVQPISPKALDPKMDMA